MLFISSGSIQKQYNAEFNDIWRDALNQRDSNTPVGYKRSPTNTFNNPIDQQIFSTRRHNQIGFRNGGY